MLQLNYFVDESKHIVPDQPAPVGACMLFLLTSFIPPPPAKQNFSGVYTVLYYILSFRQDFEVFVE